MRRFFNALLCLFLLFFGAWTDIGINFRATAGFVTDGANETYSLAEAYPTTRGGATFGWTDGLGGDRTRDRNAAIDRRMAGANFTNSTGSQDRVTVFQLDLPAAGTYDIRVAVGDESNPRTNQKLEIFDNVTSKGVLVNDASTAAAHWVDATNVERTSDSDWSTNNAKATITFASTTLVIKTGTTAATTDNTFLSHIRVVQVSTGVYRRQGIEGGFSGMVGDLK